MRDHLHGKTVLITGGSSGFGLETARLLLERGCRVAISGRDQDRLAAAERDLAGADRLLALRADATAGADWRRLLDAVEARFAIPDVIINNHGAGVRIAPIEQQDDASIDAALAINLASVIRGCREALPRLRKAGRGHIVNVGSACSYHSWPDWSVYTAAKAGLIGFTRCLHLEMAPWGGKATSFIPGAARTGFSAAAGLPPTAEDLPGALDFAEALVKAIDVPPQVFIEELSVWGTSQVLTPF